MSASRGNTAGGMFKDPTAEIANSRTGFKFPSEQANYAGRTITNPNESQGQKFAPGFKIQSKQPAPKF